MRISWTISWYIFRDLLKIFMMASGALAGIMSFGGLLRPLTQQGLDARQVGELLSWFSPAMTAYSFPIAALFATTVVYGRLSADNEITACRAGGMSFFSISIPAIVLGLIVALVSLLFLSFIVPRATLKVEQIIYSNIAKLIANKIDRTRQISFGQATVFAQEAFIPPDDKLPKNEQQVVLLGPTIVTFERSKPKEDWQYRVPVEFWTASQATVYINRREETDKIELTVALRDGMKMPREFRGGLQASVGATHFGPLEISSPIKENTKFMDVWQLKELSANLQGSRRIRKLQEEFIDRYQRYEYAWSARNSLNKSGKLTFTSLQGDETFEIERGPNLSFERVGELVVGPRGDELDKSGNLIRTPAPDEERPVKLWRIVKGQVDTITEAYDARIRIRPVREDNTIDVTIELRDTSTPSEEGPISRASVQYTFPVAMPDSLRKLENQPLEKFLSPEWATFGHQLPLKREALIITNDIISESNSRASFAVSCLILVLVGCTLGMMFRSGNFLTAFAVSFIPALLSITLIIAGQQVAGSIGWKLGPEFKNPLSLGVGLIWSGNVANLAVAGALMWKLWRT